jgi:hypothetical protein
MGFTWSESSRKMHRSMQRHALMATAEHWERIFFHGGGDMSQSNRLSMSIVQVRMRMRRRQRWHQNLFANNDLWKLVHPAWSPVYQHQTFVCSGDWSVNWLINPFRNSKDCSLRSFTFLMQCQVVNFEGYSRTELADSNTLFRDETSRYQQPNWGIGYLGL